MLPLVAAIALCRVLEVDGPVLREAPEPIFLLGEQGGTSFVIRRSHVCCKFRAVNRNCGCNEWVLFSSNTSTLL